MSLNLILTISFNILILLIIVNAAQSTDFQNLGKVLEKNEAEKPKKTWWRRLQNVNLPRLPFLFSVPRGGKFLTAQELALSMNTDPIFAIIHACRLQNLLFLELTKIFNSSQSLKKTPKKSRRVSKTIRRVVRNTAIGLSFRTAPLNLASLPRNHYFLESRFEIPEKQRFLTIRNPQLETQIPYAIEIPTALEMAQTKGWRNKEEHLVLQSFTDFSLQVEIRPKTGTKTTTQVDVPSSVNSVKEKTKPNARKKRKPGKTVYFSDFIRKLNDENAEELTTASDLTNRINRIQIRIQNK